MMMIETTWYVDEEFNRPTRSLTCTIRFHSVSLTGRKTAQLDLRINRTERLYTYPTVVLHACRMWPRW